MKITAFLFIAFLGCGIISKGQDQHGELYWVIESNTNIPDSSIVKIYNQRNELLHEVKLNTRLDIANRKHRKALDQMVKRYTNRATEAARVSDGRPSAPKV